MTKVIGLGMLALALAAGAAGCKENASASAACASQGDSDSCNTCCKANGANGYKFVSGSCACLGGKDAPAAAAPAPPPAAPAQGAAPFALAKAAFSVGEGVAVTFTRDMTTPAGQQYWITITKPTDPDTEWGSWQYVPQSARSVVLPAPLPGDWEVRLHDLYPMNPSRVIGRQRISVR